MPFFMFAYRRMSIKESIAIYSEKKIIMCLKRAAFPQFLEIYST